MRAIWRFDSAAIPAANEKMEIRNAFHREPEIGGIHQLLRGEPADLPGHCIHVIPTG